MRLAVVAALVGFGVMILFGRTAGLIAYAVVAGVGSVRWVLRHVGFR